MVAKVAINGFGRIGRLVLRGILESGRKDIEVVAINDLGSGRDQRPSPALRQRPRPLSPRGQGRGRLDGRRRPQDQGDGDQGSGRASPQGARRRRRARMHRHLHRAREGGGASQGGREARPHFGAGGRRGPHRRLRRQRRQADQGLPRRLQRVLHHQLPRAGRESAQRRDRHRARIHDHRSIPTPATSRRSTRCTRISIARAARRSR